MAEVDFTGFNLACISGANGAGKSSLLDAITWVLFGKARQNDDSVINLKKDTARVVFIFNYEGETYRVIREKHKNKTGVLEFNIKAAGGDWTVLTRESIRKTEELIRDTLKMEYETFINASFFLQGKADQFAQKNPAQRKEILSSILGLDRWETYRLEASQRGKQVKSEIERFDGQLTEIKSELAEEDQRKQKLAEEEAACAAVSTKRAEKQVLVQNAQKLDAALQTQKAAVQRMDRDQQTAKMKSGQTRMKMEELDGLILVDQTLIKDEPQIEAQFREWNTIREEREKIQGIANRYHRLAEIRNPLLNKISAEDGRLRQRLSQLCEIKKNLPATQAELDRLTKSLPEQKHQLDDWQAAVDKRSELTAQLQSLRDEITNARSDANRIETDIKKMIDRFERLQKTTGAECPLCGQPLTDSHRDDLLADIKNEGQELRARQDTCKQLINQKEKEAGILEQQIRELDLTSRQLLAGQQNYFRDSELQTKKLQEKKDQESAVDEEATIQAMLDSGMYAAEIREEESRIKAEMDALKYDESKLIQLSTRESELRSVEHAHSELNIAKTRLEQRLEQKKTLGSQLEEIENDLARITSELEEARKQLEDQSNGLPDLAELTRQLNLLSDEEASRLKLLGEARSRVKVLEEKRKQEKQINEDRNEKSRQLDRLKILEKAFGKSGVPALLIEEALPEIELRANEILGRLSNDEMSVQLVTQKDYKDKKREDKQETLDILISDGAGERAYELFSGGEAFRVNFAIRLALSQELAHRAGARLQTLVIDEGFGSQDADGRQRLIETINIVQQNFEKILVITHMEELKEAFPARIEVEKTPHGSMVTVP
jgi:exonuclease SbcC